VASESANHSIPRATVVVPVRNGAGVIGSQLRALDNQTIARDLEVIVVDDGSSDGTADIVETHLSTHDFADLVLIRRSRRGGPNAARNDGIGQARTAHILLCDGDDVVDRHWAERLLAVLEAETCDSTLVTGLGVSLTEDDLLGADVLLDPTRMTRRPFMLGGNGGFARSLAVRLGGFDEQIRAGGTERDFCLRAEYVGARIVLVPDALIGYRTPVGRLAQVRAALRRTRGHAYLWQRHRARVGADAGSGRPFAGLLRAVSDVGRGRKRPWDLVLLVTTSIGFVWWSLVFAVRLPPARLSLSERGIADGLGRDSETGHDSEVR